MFNCREGKLSGILKIKSGVAINGLRTEALLGLIIAHSIFTSFGYDTILVSVVEAPHSRGSFHYVGLAFDLRRRHVKEEDLNPIHEALTEALGIQYDVVLEPDHWHIEYQPKKGVNL